MLRSRVRRSFTVEVKSKSRQTMSWPEDPAPSPVNWAALDPAPETPSPFEAVWPGAAPSAMPPVVAEKPRRILPSLIVAEPEPEPEALEPSVEREPRLPRVRRVKAPQARAEAPRSDATWSFSDIAAAADEPPVPVASIQRQAPVVASAPIASTPVPARKPLRMRTAEPVLAPGERWKRRLPRSCR